MENFFHNLHELVKNQILTFYYFLPNFNNLSNQLFNLKRFLKNFTSNSETENDFRSNIFMNKPISSNLFETETKLKVLNGHILCNINKYS